MLPVALPLATSAAFVFGVVTVLVHANLTDAMAWAIGGLIAMGILQGVTIAFLVLLVWHYQPVTE